MTVQRGLIIGGDELPAVDGALENDVDPWKDTVVGTVAGGRASDATRAVDAAAAAFDEWAGGPPTRRRDVLWRAADLLLERTDTICAQARAELGATYGWAAFNVQLAAEILREAAASVTAPRGEVLTSLDPSETGFAVREPAGVVAAFSPWNAPVILGARSIAVPLAVGNTVVLKPTEEAPITAGLLLADVLADAGLPPGVLNVVTNARDAAGEVAETLISDRRVRRVNFTGSTGVGRRIGVLAAEHLTPAVLELGGKNSLLVLDDADLEHAVHAATFGAYMNAGQICMSADRILVPWSMREKFTDAFAERVAALPVGDPGDPNTVIGPMVNAPAANRVADMVENARGQGVTVHTGGARPDGALLAPTVLGDVTSDHRIYHDEVFGPVSTVIGYNDLEEAIGVANDTPYGLSSGVITEERGRGWAVAQQLRSGIVHINDQTVHDEPQAPFGGVGDSGYGRFGGRQGIESFTETRWISVHQGHKSYPI